MKQGRSITIALVATALVTAAPAAATPGDFALGPTSPLPGATEPLDVAVGDFNGDGNNDAATADNTVPGEVTIFLGNGAGRLTEAVTSPEAAGSDPGSIAVGLFNNDANLDLAVGNETGGNVSILIGGGDGNFTAGTSVSAGTNPSDVAVGNLNAGLVPDLAITNRGSDNVTIALGNGDGTFTAGPDSPEAAGDGAESVATADLDGDADGDLAVSNVTAGTISILLNNGSGNFAAAASSPETGAAGQDLVAGGFDAGTSPDLAVTGSGQISILLNNGSADFSAASGSPEGVSGFVNDLAVSDLNGDAKPDLTAATSAENVPVLLNDGTGNFAEPATSPEDAGPIPVAVATGEFGGDINPDLVVSGLGGLASTLINNPVDRTLTLRYKRGPKAFVGKLASADPGCAGGHRVSVFKLGSGGEKLIGKDKTAASGKYAVTAKRRRGKYVARTASAPESGGGFCNSAQSTTLKLR